MGVTIVLDIDPSYDNPVRGKIQHPLGGPAYSYRYDILDLGTSTEPNIQKCKVKGHPDESRGY
jgi:hypothetical protein